MRVEAECAACFLHRGYRQIIEATDNQTLQFEAMSAITRLLAKEFKPRAIAANIGTQRDRVIKRITGNPDPYAEKKRMSNLKALEVLPLAKKLVSSGSSPEDRFRRACLCSIVGNIIEFDVLGHRFEFEEVGGMIQQAEKDLVVDEIPKIFAAAKKAKDILYLTDNAGEIVFDTLFVQELRALDPRIVVAVKDKPILNDATMEDAKQAGMHETADAVITLGTDTVGLIPKECSDEFLNHYRSADLIMAKGMGYAETLTELPLASPHALLLRTKCRPIANFFNVSKNRNIAKLMHQE